MQNLYDMELTWLRVTVCLERKEQEIELRTIGVKIISVGFLSAYQKVQENTEKETLHKVL